MKIPNLVKFTPKQAHIRAIKKASSGKKINLKSFFGSL